MKFSDAPFEPWPVMRHSAGESPHIWTGWDSRRSYELDEPYVEPNAEMAAIYQADQTPRQSLQSFYANATQIDKDDAARRGRVRELIDKGQRASDDLTDFKPVIPDIVVRTTAADIQKLFDPVLERAVNCPAR